MSISKLMFLYQSGFDVECANYPEHHLWSVWGNQPWGLAGLDTVWGDAGQVNKSLLWIRIRIHFGRLEYGSGSRRAKIKMTHKSEQNSSARCYIMRDEDFSCSLDVLYGGLGIGKLQFFYQKIRKISTVNFFLFLVIKTLDLNPDPHWNQCGSTTLPEITHKSINMFQYPINATFLIIL